ncbi:MAG: YesL family protein [Angelakisella sp.]
MPQSRFWRFFGLLADLFLLNMLWIVGSIPLVTIGASTTALYYSMIKKWRGEEGPVIAIFRKSYKQNLGQSTFLWLLIAFAGGDLYLLYRSFGQYRPVQLVLLLLGFVCLLVALYAFPVVAMLSVSNVQCLQNAFLMAFRHLWASLLMLAVDGVLLYITFCVFPPLFLLVFGLMAYHNSYFISRLLTRYTAVESSEMEETGL